MLGSNPNPSVILSYLNLFLSNTYHSPHILFLFCNSQVGTINPLLLLHLLQKHKEYPKHLTIVPTPHQEDQAIAPLLQRTNTMITKSGGLSSMEILTACKGDIFIHEEPKKQNHPGMPLWEKGNARYLAHYKQAQFVTPSTFPLTSLLNTTPSSSCVSGP